MKSFVLVIAATLVASSSDAAPVNQAGAERLREALETFLSRPGPADERAVFVKPAGESYRVSIDAERLLKPLEQYGLELTFSEVSFSAAPQPDGTWRVGDWPKSLSLNY